MANGEWRARQRHLQDHRRRPTWTRLAGGLPDRPHRPHRPRHLSEESGHPVRGDRERQSATPPDAAARDGAGGDGRAAGRVDHRRRGLSHGRRRRDVDEDERRRLQRQPEGSVLLQPDSRRSRTTTRTSSSRRTATVTRSTAARPGTRRDVFPRMFGDFRTLWIDPENSDRMIAGSDGGIAMSYDGGETSDHFANMPVGEIYAISVDMEEPYNIYAGLQDHEHWRGPSKRALGRVTVWDWIAVGDGDGISTLVDRSEGQLALHQARVRTHYPARSEDRRTHQHHASPAGRCSRRTGSSGRRRSYISPHNSRRSSTPAARCCCGRPIAATLDGDQPRPQHEPRRQDHAESEGGVPGRHSVVRDLVDFGIADHRAA